MGVAAGLANALAELFSCVVAIEVVDGNVRTDCSLLESNGSASPREAPVMRVVRLEFEVVISSDLPIPMVCERGIWICPLQSSLGRRFNLRVVGAVKTEELAD